LILQTLKLSTTLAWRNIWRQKRRTWLTASAISFGSILVVFMLCINYGAYAIIIDFSLRMFPGHAQIQARGYQDQPEMHKAIDNADALAEQLRRSGHYRAVTVRAQGFALVSSAERSYGASVMGVHPNTEQQVSLIPGLVKEGRFLQANNAFEAVIGSALARNLKVKPGDELTVLGSAKDGSVAATILTVVGVFRSGSTEIDRYFVEIPLGTFQETFGMGNSAHSIAVIGDDPQNQETVLANLRQSIPEGNLVVLDWDQLLPGLKEGLEFDRIGDWIFMSILLLIIIFSIFNTFLMSILERTREFGLMLALGARPRRITGVVMLESFLLTLIGTVLGTLLGTALVIWLDNVGISFEAFEEIMEQYSMPVTRIYPEVNIRNIVSGPLIILVITNLFAWIPLTHIQKLQPVDAMRTV
jgi:putative ABC transport system permease protein